MIEEKAMPFEGSPLPGCLAAVGKQPDLEGIPAGDLFCLAILAVGLVAIRRVPLVEFGTWRGSEVFLLGLVVIPPSCREWPPCGPSAGRGLSRAGRPGVAPEDF